MEKQERKWMMFQEEIDCRAGGRGGWPPGQRQVRCINLFGLEVAGWVAGAAYEC